MTGSLRGTSSPVEDEDDNDESPDDNDANSNDDKVANIQVF
jgi:hypothetical protein